MMKIGKSSKVKGLCIIFSIALLFAFGCDDSDDGDSTSGVNKSTATTKTVKIIPYGGDNYGITSLEATTEGAEGTATGYATVTGQNIRVTLASGVPAAGDGTFAVTYNDGDSEATFPGGDFTVTVDGNEGELTTGGFIDISMTDAEGNPVSGFSPGLNAMMTLSGETEGVSDGSTVKIYRVDEGKTYDSAVLEETVIVKSKDGKQYVDFTARRGNATYIVVISTPTGSSGDGGVSTT